MHGAGDLPGIMAHHLRDHAWTGYGDGRGVPPPTIRTRPRCSASRRPSSRTSPTCDHTSSGPPRPRIPPAARYRRFPRLEVPDHWFACRSGWANIADALRDDLAARRAESGGRAVLAVETYPGVGGDVLARLIAALHPDRVVRSEDAFASPRVIADLVAPDLTDDPVFGRVSELTLGRFLSQPTVERLRLKIDAAGDGLTLVYGVGATLLCEPDVMIYADMARRELVQRFRRDEISNLGADNAHDDWSAQYKRAWFVDWRVADRHKQDVFEQADFFLDTHDGDEPKLAPGRRRGRRAGPSRPGTVEPGPLLRPRPVGWPVDEGGLRPRRGDRQLRLVLQLCARRRTASCSTSVTASWSCRRSTWCCSSRSRCSVSTSIERLRRGVPDPVRLPRHHGRRQPLLPGPSGHVVHPGHVSDALHPGRELLPGGRLHPTRPSISACATVSIPTR